MTVTRITVAADKDAEYVLRRLQLIEECDSSIKDRTRERDGARAEAGARLIEVRERVSRDKTMSRDTHNAPGWLAWLRAAGIAHQTASDLMRFAGFTEEERATNKKAQAAKKKKKRKAKVRDFVFEADCDDCLTEEERWQRSFSVHAGDAIALWPYWTKEFGKWDAFAVTTDMVTLAEQAITSWQQILVELKRRRK